MADRLKQIALHTMGSIAPQASSLGSIIKELTLEEKVSLLAGKDFWTTNAVPRLGVPSLKVSDGPNGARGEAFKGGVKSACFPACVSLAATFDKGLARHIGKALAEETRTKGATVLLGPTVCPHRDPRGGRNFESFSEDPLLAGELAAEYINGLQAEGVGATIKHYAANESETKRFTIDAEVSARALREIYLKPFEIAVKKSDPWALMTSYNLVNGTHADSNEFLIRKVLREEWGFKGLIMSDWGGVNSTAESLNAGHDLEMPGPASWRTVAKVAEAIKKGKLTEATLNGRVKKVLELLERTGKFDDPTIPEEKAVDKASHRELIRRAGAEGMVLLKNEAMFCLSGWISSSRWLWLAYPKNSLGMAEALPP
ncbi:Beta-glucosidase B [Cyphellophora attinorum]|uniref:beta-glucosidase n=1 Tax=Cyphellophora attinorum TaxID=1664694 RepID=A0A0N1H7R6_9EURO|nr:Beta-glucosidase B [Phialophora attinorum]KPI37717.1 Beta-glucosidase B [Phialophora attinorum]